MIERECDRSFGYLGEKGDRSLGFDMGKAIALFVVWGRGAIAKPRLYKKHSRPINRYIAINTITLSC